MMRHRRKSSFVLAWVLKSYVLILLAASHISGADNVKISEESLRKHLTWFGQSSFKWTTDRTIYIDPWELPEKEKDSKADLILITHPHMDHLSLKDIEMIRKPGTVFVGPPDCTDKIKGFGDIRSVKPGDVLDILGVHIEVVPAYNLIKPYHPREKVWVGYIIQMGGERIYHPGDTDFIPEMKGLKTDVALLPIGGTYTMDVREAADATDAIHPQLAIPMHYGRVVGKPEDAETFKKLCTVPVMIMKKQE